MKIIKKILNRIKSTIWQIITFPILLLIGLLIWIDWKMRSKGLPIDCWGDPHPHK